MPWPPFNLMASSLEEYNNLQDQLYVVKLYVVKGGVVECCVVEGRCAAPDRTPPIYWRVTP